MKSHLDIVTGRLMKTLDSAETSPHVAISPTEGPEPQ